MKVSLEFDVGKRFYLWLIDRAIDKAMHAYDLSSGPETYETGFFVGFTEGESVTITRQARIHAQHFNIMDAG